MKNLDKKLKENRQYRTLALVIPNGTEQEKRFDTDYYVEGYATTFEPYVLMEDRDGNPIYERFTRETFAETDMSDVIFQLNHEGRVFARLSNETLALEVDDHGLKIYADLGKTTSSRMLYEDIQAGLITKMSWGFRPGIYSFDRASRTLIHKSVKKIYDVSAVSIPANDGTEISVRTLVDGEIERERVEQLKREALLLEIEIEMERFK